MLVVFAATNFIGLAAAAFFLSFTMTLAFMKVRDDYLVQFQSREQTIKAIGYVNLVTNIVLTISSLLRVGFFLNLARCALIAFASLQTLLYLGVRLVRRAGRAR